MQIGNTYRVRTISTTHFTGALAQNAAAVEDIDAATLANTPGAAGAGLTAGKHTRCRVHGLRIISKENLAWELEFWGAKLAGTPGGAVIDTEFFFAKFGFLAADGTQATGDTFFHYYVPVLEVCYADVDQSGKIHLRLINRSAAAKTAGAGGVIVVELEVEPTQGGA